MPATFYKVQNCSIKGGQTGQCLRAHRTFQSKPAGFYSFAQLTGVTIINFGVLSGDAAPNTCKAIIESSILKQARPRALIIMHFIHPEWNSNEALQAVIPALLKSGYLFVRLNDFACMILYIQCELR